MFKVGDVIKLKNQSTYPRFWARQEFFVVENVCKYNYRQFNNQGPLLDFDPQIRDQVEADALSINCLSPFDEGAMYANNWWSCSNPDRWELVIPKIEYQDADNRLP